jgi:hypothetical protein
MFLSSFFCRRCSFISRYPDSLRRHYVRQHGVGVRIGRSGRHEEFDLSDAEEETTRVRRRQTKGPYPKESSRRRSPNVPHPTMDRPTHASITAVPLMSLQVATPPDHLPSDTNRTASKSPFLLSNTTSTHADAVNPTVSESNPEVAHFSPVDRHLDSSPALTSPPGGAVLLDLGTNLADLAQSSPDPFWSFVAGPASSVDTAFEAPMSTPPAVALCRGVRRSKGNGLHTSMHMVESATSPLAPTITSSHVIPSTTDPTPLGVISTAVDVSVPGDGISTSSCKVARRRIHASGNPAPCQNRLSGFDLMDLIQTWGASDEAALRRLRQEATSLTSGDRSQLVHDINLVRRTARCLAGFAISGVFDDTQGVSATDVAA